MTQSISGLTFRALGDNLLRWIVPRPIDCTVDFYDLDAFCSYWPAECPDQFACGGADFAENGYIDFADFSALANNWLQTGPP